MDAFVFLLLALCQFLSFASAFCNSATSLWLLYSLACTSQVQQKRCHCIVSLSFCQLIFQPGALAGCTNQLWLSGFVQFLRRTVEISKDCFSFNWFCKRVLPSRLSMESMVRRRLWAWAMIVSSSSSSSCSFPSSIFIFNYDSLRFRIHRLRWDFW